MPELKSCPFCGGQLGIATEGGHTDDCYIVMMLRRKGEPAELNAAWNRRASPAALTDAARRLMLAADAVDLGRSIHNERKTDDKIEGPVWGELRRASTEIRALLAASPAEQVEDARIPGRVDTEWHDLKADAHVFEEVITGRKASEIRFDDRGYQVGHVLRLRETRHTGAEMKAGAPLEYTGREVIRVVSHIQRGYGLGDGWVCLSFDAAMSASKEGEQNG